MLVARCLGAVERVREASNLDEWIDGQCLVYGLFRGLQQFVAYVLPDPPLGLKTIMSQLEEIAADAGALYGTDWVCEPSYEEFAAYARHVVGSHSESARLEGERLLVPRSLDAWFHRENRGPLPSEWTSLSYLLAIPWTAVSQRRPGGPRTYRTRPLDIPKLLTADPLATFLVEHGLDRGREHRGLIESFYSQSRMLRFVPGELGIDEDDLTTAVLAAHTTLCMQEQFAMEAKAEEYLSRGDSAGALAIVQDGLSLYPAASALLAAGARAFEAAGRIDDAYTYLVRAAIVDPVDRDVWLQLRSLLIRTKRTDEAAAVSAIADQVAQRG
jgi:tetratricopeptide (TPR) repeat protein